MHPFLWLSESIKKVIVKCPELLKEAVKTRKAGSTSAAIEIIIRGSINPRRLSSVRKSVHVSVDSSRYALNPTTYRSPLLLTA